MLDHYQQILRVATEEERGKLITLHEACLKLHEQYKGNPQADIKKSWDAAERGKRDTIEALWAKYYQHEPVFTDRAAVLSYLEKQGYKIKKTKLYRDAQKGLLKIEPDGSVLEIAVRAYMAALAKKDIEDPAAKTAQKIDEEIRGLKLKNERQQIELDVLKNKYIERDEAVFEFCAKFSILREYLRYFITTQTPALIDLCRGDQTCSSAVMDLLNPEIHNMFNRIAKTDRFEVTFVAGEADSKALAGDDNNEADWE